MYGDLKRSLKEMEGELGIDELKHELNRGIAEEKAKLEEEMTVIVDMYGNEHHVPNVKKVRPDLSEEEVELEIKKHNEENSKITKL